MPDTVLVARESTELQAEILRGRLEADGIEAFLRGAGVASTVGPINELNVSWGNPLGGIEVRVRAEQVDEARAILAEIHSRARAGRVKRRWPNALQALAGIGVAMVLLPPAIDEYPAIAIVLGVAIAVGTVKLSRL